MACSSSIVYRYWKIKELVSIYGISFLFKQRQNFVIIAQHIPAHRIYSTLGTVREQSARKLPIRFHSLLDETYLHATKIMKTPHTQLRRSPRNIDPSTLGHQKAIHHGEQQFCSGIPINTCIPPAHRVITTPCTSREQLHRIHGTLNNSL